MPKAPQALVGGQAVIEGVMMRAPGGVACAVRRPDGSIAVRYDKHVPFAKRFFLFKLPIFRGAVTTSTRCRATRAWTSGSADAP